MHSQKCKRFVATLSRSLAIFAITGGCSGTSSDGEAPFDEFQVMSLDGTGKTMSEQGYFHGYPVCKTTIVRDRNTQNNLHKTLEDAIRRGPEQSPKCFTPRHGVRWRIGSATHDYVVCFECSNFLEYVDGKVSRNGSLNADVANMFDDVLGSRSQ